MKKLNRKGFTLIELLAVVVILAVILVVTIPSVLGTMADARYKSLQNAAETTAEWFAKQYDLATLGSDLSVTGGVDAAYTAFPATTTSKTFNTTDGKAAIKAAGIARADTNLDLANSSIQLKNKKVCVILTAKANGSFYNSTDNNKNNVSSSGC